MIRLTSLVRLLSSKVGMDVLAVSTVDDFFKEISALGIDKVSVTQEQMSMICQFYLAMVGNDKNGNQGEILRTNKLPELMGVKIELESMV